MDLLIIFIQLFSPIVLLLLGMVIGTILENNHFANIREREKQFRNKPVLSIKTLPDQKPVVRAEMVTGSVVVSVDHFKRFLMFFRKIFGGEIRGYSPLIERGRREAILRMQEACPRADLYLNFRLQTATLSSGKGRSVGTVEVLAYATAICYQK